MSTLITGDRLGATASLSVAVSGIIFDDQRRILLVQRADNGRWCLPGGRVEPGESLTEACEREVGEETGLRVRVTGIMGMITNPHLIMEYPNGQAWQCIELDFACMVLGTAAAQCDDETVTWGYCSLAQLTTLDIMETDLERIEKALKGEVPYF